MRINSNVTSFEEQNFINNWFDERIKKLELVVYTTIGTQAVLISLAIAIFAKLFLGI